MLSRNALFSILIVWGSQVFTAPAQAEEGAEAATPQTEPGIAPAATASNTDVIYKWQDKSGQWHFSQTQPTTHPAESVSYAHKDDAVAPAVSEPSSNDETASKDAAAKPEEEKPVKKKKRKLIIPSYALNKKPEFTVPASSLSEAGIGIQSSSARSMTQVETEIRYIERYPEKCRNRPQNMNNNATSGMAGGGMASLGTKANLGGGLSVAISAPKPTPYYDPDCP